MTKELSIVSTLTSSFFKPGKSAWTISLPSRSDTSIAGDHIPAPCDAKSGIQLPANARSICSVNRLIKLNGLAAKKSEGDQKGSLLRKPPEVGRRSNVRDWLPDSSERFLFCVACSSMVIPPNETYFAILEPNS